MSALTPVKSSNIAALGYDAGTNTLTVSFKNGNTHHYSDVPQKDYDALLSAESVGKHFHKNIRSAFRGVKV